jgi:hypothetical protein
MDKQSSEIIDNFINFLKSKKDVLHHYDEKYSKSAKDDITIKKYEWEDIISESNDIISQSIQAIKSLQMENENLKETIMSIQALQQSSNLKQSVFSFEGKGGGDNYNIEDHLGRDEDNFENEARNRGYNLEISKENDLHILKKEIKFDNNSKELLEEEVEILPHTPYEPVKNNVNSTINNNNHQNYDYQQKEIIINKYDRNDGSTYKNEDFGNHQIAKHINGSPSFSKNSKQSKLKGSPDKKTSELNENILIVDSYNVARRENEKDWKPSIASREPLKQSDEDQHYQEEFYKNFDNSQGFNTITNPISSLNKSPLKVGIRQKLKNIASKESQNNSCLKSDNQSINYNINSRSQTLNLSNIYSNQERGKYKYNRRNRNSRESKQVKHKSRKYE